ncbi:MAG: hypothetical protein ABI230_13380 [Aestuariivirga sp.]
MGIIRDVVAIGLGFLVMKAAQRMLASAQAQQERVKAKANKPAAGRIPTLKLDPVTGIYRPEV